MTVEYKHVLVTGAAGFIGSCIARRLLREDAQIVGDVTVIGKTDHLEVWNTETIRRNLKDEPLTDTDREKLAEQGF